MPSAYLANPDPESDDWDQALASARAARDCSANAAARSDPESAQAGGEAEQAARHPDRLAVRAELAPPGSVRKMPR